MKKLHIALGITLAALLAGCAGTGNKPLTAEGLFDRHVEVAYGGKGMGMHQSVPTRHFIY